MPSKKAEPTRRVKIDKAQSTSLAIIAVASFVAVFSIFSSRALISKYFYQSKVINAEKTSLNQVAADKQAASSLISSYTSFANQSTNILGGISTGSGLQDGPNGRIILDSLPDAYDFPALATSIVKILTNQGVVISSLTGSDTSNGSLIAPVGSATTPTPIPFGFDVTGTYSSDQAVLLALQESIRPIQIISLAFTGSDSALSMTVEAQTYYQIPQGLSVTTEIIQ